MNLIERTIVIGALINMAIYVPCFFLLFFPAANGFSHTLIAWHIVGMLLNFVVIVLTIRDLYRRRFANPNSKITWCLLICCTGGIGWIVYVFKHAFRPRVHSTPE